MAVGEPVTPYLESPLEENVVAVDSARVVAVSEAWFCESDVICTVTSTEPGTTAVMVTDEAGMPIEDATAEIIVALKLVNRMASEVSASYEAWKV